jgi:DNA primase
MIPAPTHHTPFGGGLIDDIKSRLDLAEVAGSYLELKREGRYLRALCPFHPDHNTPSFTIYPDSQRWKCFGVSCGRSGDVLDLVQRLENWDFPTTLRSLAEKAGLPPKELSPEAQKRLDQQRERERTLGAAQTFFQDELFSSRPEGYSYAASRGWSGDTVYASGIGFFANSWDDLSRRFVQLGIDPCSPAAVAFVGFKGDVSAWGRAWGVEPPRGWVEAGKIPRMPPDMLIYPHLERGAAAYLSGRFIKAKGHWNPPQDLVGPRRPFYNHCWWSTAPASSRVVVEGQADAVTLADWGIPAAALVGSTLGDSLLQELHRRIQGGGSILIGLDQDDAGREAARKAAAAMVEAGFPAHRTGLVDWPAHDANDWLQSGATRDQAHELLGRPATWLDVLIEEAAADRGTAASVRPLFAALAAMDNAERVLIEDTLLKKISLTRSQYRHLLNVARREKRQAEGSSSCRGEAYVVLDSGMYRRVISPAGEESLEPLSNFTAKIEQENLKDNGQDIEREFRISGMESGVPFPTARVKSSEYCRMDWVLRDWGTRAILDAGALRREHLRAAIQYSSSDIERRTIYTHTGWRDLDGRRTFLSASGALGAAGVEVELDRDLQLYALPDPAENVPAALRASLDFLKVAPLRVTAPLWASIWLAPIRDEVLSAFTLWLYGVTGTMKSTLAALLLNHYGPGFDDKHLPGSFTDTANRLEHKAFVIKDAPFVIDDYAPQKDLRTHSEYVRSAQRLIRGTGNQTGRGRLQADASARSTYYPRSLLIITGEDLPESESILARMFVVDVEKRDVNRQRLTALQYQRELLSHAMSAYLQYLSQDWAELTRTARQNWHKYREWALRDSVHLRLPEAIACLGTGFNMGLRFALHMGVISREEGREMMQAAMDALLESAQRMRERIAAEKPEEMFITTLRELLAQGKILLRSRDGLENLGGPEERAEMLGWFDADRIFLLPDACYTRVARHYRDRGSVFPVRESTLRKNLKEAGLIQEKNRRYTETLWLQGQVRRVIALPRSILGDSDGGEE